MVALAPRPVRHLDERVNQGFACEPVTNSDGSYTYCVKGIRKVPYRLPGLREAIARGEAIFIAEGEKCVEALAGLGFAATCNVGGANKWPDQITPYFKGYRHPAGQ